MCSSIFLGISSCLHSLLCSWTHRAWVLPGLHSLEPHNPENPQGTKPMNMTQSVSFHKYIELFRFLTWLPSKSFANRLPSIFSESSLEAPSTLLFRYLSAEIISISRWAATDRGGPVGDSELYKRTITDG